MTGPEFAAQHGDSDTWTTADIETQQNLAAIDTLPEPDQRPPNTRRTSPPPHGSTGRFRAHPTTPPRPSPPTLRAVGLHTANHQTDNTPSGACFDPTGRHFESSHPHFEGGCSRFAHTPNRPSRRTP